MGNVIYDGQKQYFPSLIKVASHIFAAKKELFDERNMI